MITVSLVKIFCVLVFYVSGAVGYWLVNAATTLLDDPDIIRMFVAFPNPRRAARVSYAVGIALGWWYFAAQQGFRYVLRRLTQENRS